MTRRSRQPRNALRVIGGRWRGSRLSFPDRTPVRPTPDRVRETLFNWLAPILPGARCLDLFAGTGALGLEALSRGAGHVTFVERDRALAEAIEGHLERLEGRDGEVVQADAFAWLAGADGPFDIVFLDPPFDCDRLGELCTLLCSNRLIRPGSRIYVEFPLHRLPETDARLQIHREGKAGQVGYRLLVPSDSSDADDT